MIELRSLLFRAILFLSSPIYALIMMPLFLFGAGGARTFGKLWARMVFLELHLICGITHKIEGAENIPKGGAIVASNHQSMWETFALYVYLPKPSIILKKELMQIPVFGWFLRPTGNIVIDRSGGAKALRALTRDARSAIAAGHQVIVFPEGTRVRPCETKKFQPGVAGIYLGAETACHPVTHNSGEFWQFPGFRKAPGEITLRFLTPIQPGMDRRAFRSLLERTINANRPDIKRNVGSVEEVANAAQ